MAKAKAKKVAKRSLAAVVAVGYDVDGNLVVGVSTPQTCTTVNRAQAVDDANDNGYGSALIERIIEIEGPRTKKKQKQPDAPVSVVKL